MTAYVDYEELYELDYTDWLYCQIAQLTSQVIMISPSEWAEQNRVLPMSVTPVPGFYRYNVNPFLREIVDCADIRSNIKEVNVKKGIQIGATVGVLENIIGYGIAVLKSSPIMLMTVDADMVKIRMDQYITPMIQQSGLEDLIRSSDEGNSRKTGKTDKKLEWEGGGFLLPFGANSAGKLRSISVQYLLQDECDGYKIRVGKDGDPSALAEGRTAAFDRTKKVFRVSTPLIHGQSKIDDGFKRGDQRYYHVPCKGCGEYQVLRFQGVNKETGAKWGLVWDMDEDGHLVPDSTRYVCRFCGYQHRNADKTFMLPRGRWIPSAKPAAPTVRSYHISALYSPAVMFSWDSFVLEYLKAWDVENNRVKDIEKLQTFYNNMLGETFEVRGDKLRFVTVSAHRRKEYRYGEVPNQYAQVVTGSPVIMLTAAVDVHKDNLAVAVFGHTVGRRKFLIDYWRFEGKCEDPTSEPWQKVYELYTSKIYTADDGKKYPITQMLIDSSYNSQVVYAFCNQFGDGVYPIQGREIKYKAICKEFGTFVTSLGTNAFGITVDIYKDRHAMSLRRSWDGMGLQPEDHFNAPIDCTDKQIKELTVESKREKIEKTTGKRVGFEWHRPNGSDNELWDLLQYSAASYDIICWDLCINQLELPQVSYDKFEQFCLETELYFISPEVESE